MDTPVLIDQQKLTFILNVRTIDIVEESYQEPWPIWTDVKGIRAVDTSYCC